MMPSRKPLCSDIGWVPAKFFMGDAMIDQRPRVKWIVVVVKTEDCHESAARKAWLRAKSNQHAGGPAGWVAGLPSRSRATRHRTSSAVNPDAPPGMDRRTILWRAIAGVGTGGADIPVCRESASGGIPAPRTDSNPNTIAVEEFRAAGMPTTRPWAQLTRLRSDGRQECLPHPGERRSTGVTKS